MNKILIAVLAALATASIASSSGVGYGLMIDHVPWWGLKFGGLGVGKSIRYDHRFYPYLGMPWIAKESLVPPPLVKPILPPPVVNPIFPPPGLKSILPPPMVKPIIPPPMVKSMMPPPVIKPILPPYGIFKGPVY